MLLLRRVYHVTGIRLAVGTEGGLYISSTRIENRCADFRLPNEAGECVVSDMKCIGEHQSTPPVRSI
jgi:hypothetical protein